MRGLWLSAGHPCPQGSCGHAGVPALPYLTSLHGPTASQCCSEKTSWVPRWGVLASWAPGTVHSVNSQFL